jgi:hypothetical protein
MKFPQPTITGQIFVPHEGASYSYRWNGAAWDVIRSSDESNAPIAADGSSPGFVKKLAEDVYNEIPTGEINGSNLTFELEYSPILGSEHVYLNGLVQRRGIDYTITDNYINLAMAPFPGEMIICSYSKSTIMEILNEIPVGAINGANNRFVLTRVPIPKSEYLYLNGILLIKGDGLDYTIEDNIITLNEFPESGERLTCTYRTNL